MSSVQLTRYQWSNRGTSYRLYLAFVSKVLGDGLGMWQSALNLPNAYDWCDFVLSSITLTFREAFGRIVIQLAGIGRCEKKSLATDKGD